MFNFRLLQGERRRPRLEANMVTWTNEILEQFEKTSITSSKELIGIKHIKNFIIS